MITTENHLLRRIFGTRSDAAVKAIETSEPVQHWLADLDAAEVARRVALAKELAQLPAKHEPRCAAATQAVEKARLVLLTAEAAVKDAGTAYSAALGASVAISHGYQAERGRLERELEESCDPRINAFIAALHQLFNDARHVSPEFTAVDIGRDHYVADGSKARAACEAVRSAIDQARDMRLQPLNGQGVARQLQALADDLRKPLGAVGMRPPAVLSPEGLDAMAR